MKKYVWLQTFHKENLVDRALREVPTDWDPFHDGPRSEKISFSIESNQNVIDVDVQNDEHPTHTAARWSYEVAHSETVLGYWDWAFDRQEYDARKAKSHKAIPANTGSVIGVGNIGVMLADGSLLKLGDCFTVEGTYPFFNEGQENYHARLAWDPDCYELAYELYPVSEAVRGDAVGGALVDIPISRIVRRDPPDEVMNADKLRIKELEAQLEEETRRTKYLRGRLDKYELRESRMREVLDLLSELGARLNADEVGNSHFTMHPMFCQEIMTRTAGFDTSLSDEKCWFNPELCETYYADDDEVYCQDGEWYVTTDEGPVALTEENGFNGPFGYQDRWEIVMIALTKEGLERYMKQDGHNVRGKAFRGKTRVVVESFNRCLEMINLRENLMRLADIHKTEGVDSADGTPTKET